MKHKFEVGDRVHFNYDGIESDGTILDIPSKWEGKFALVYMDEGKSGHGKDRRCWNVLLDQLILLKPKKQKKFL